MLAKGGTISAGLIRSLQRMNVLEVAIEDGNSHNVEAVREKIAALRNRFAGHEENPFMCEIERIVREHVEKSIAPLQDAQ